MQPKLVKLEFKLGTSQKSGSRWRNLSELKYGSGTLAQAMAYTDAFGSSKTCLQASSAVAKNIQRRLHLRVPMVARLGTASQCTLMEA